MQKYINWCLQCEWQEAIQKKTSRLHFGHGSSLCDFPPGIPWQTPVPTTRLRPELVTFAPNHSQTWKSVHLENAGTPTKSTYAWSVRKVVSQKSLERKSRFEPGYPATVELPQGRLVSNRGCSWHGADGGNSVYWFSHWKVLFGRFSTGSKLSLSC